MRFRTLLTLAVSLPLLAASTAVIAVMYTNANRRSREIGERLLMAATFQAGQQVRLQSRQAANLVQGLVELSRNTLPLNDSDHLAEALAGVLRANAGITWISFSGTEGDFTGAYRDVQGRICSNQSRIVQGRTHLVEYVLAGNGMRTLLHQDPDSGYDPRTRPFYVSATAAPGIVWSDPYIFYNQNIPGISCSEALKSTTGQLRGVFSVDYDLNGLSAFARRVITTEHSQVMIFTAQRVLVAHSRVKVMPAGNRGAAGRLLSLADVENPITRRFDQSLSRIVLKDIPSGTTRTVEFAVAGARYMACLMPVELADGPQQYVATVAPKDDFAPSAWQMSRTAILAAATALLLATLAALILANRVSAPLTALVRTSERIGRGDLNVTFELGSLYEFRHLADALHAMLANLRDWVRVRTDLDLAMEVQRRLLPAAPPRVAGFDVAGYSAYCDETGGDYYDFILVDTARSHRFVVALGDVMGHGLPSALLMAGTRGILRSGISAHALPGELLTHINGLLALDTEGIRFVTMCIASFDCEAGTCKWASAGHDPPIVFDPASNDFLEPEGGGLPLGVLQSAKFSDQPLEPITAGMVVIIGSDGVWETFSPQGEQFGKERLKALVRTHAQRSAEEIKMALITALTEFRGTSPVRDDVTFVVLKITGDAPSGAQDGADPSGN